MEMQRQSRHEVALGAGGTETPVLPSLEDLRGKKRIVLLGGSFDPPQAAHVLLGEAAGRELNADAVLYMPAARNPLKDLAPQVLDSDRICMLKAALAGRENFFVSTHEIEQGGASYTVSTLRALRAAADEDAEIYLVVGADCLTRLSQWKEIDEILKLASLRAAPREGFPIPGVDELSKTLGEPRAREILENLLQFDGPNISSSEIRAALQEGARPAAELPEEVAEYIDQHGLYRRKLPGAAPGIALADLLVVRRLSKFELHKQLLGLSDEQLLADYQRRKINWKPIVKCHESLQRAVKFLERILGADKIVTRDSFDPNSVSEDAVLMVLGGDDHLKYVAQSAGNRRILAVNPDPWRSDGALTSCMSEELPDVLDSLMTGNYTVEDWTRLDAIVDGVYAGSAMSEIRLSENDPDDMSHHRLCQGAQCAEQKGTGLLVATGAGSTGWYRSAGRYQFPKGNAFERTAGTARYILREPHEGRLLGESMWHGEITAQQSLMIESLNDGAATMSFDAVSKVPFPHGARVELRISELPLHVIKPKQ